MQVIRTVADMRAWSRREQQRGRRVVLVPTMGCLHDGHLSLVRLGRQHGDGVVLSIFVNPIQFLPGEDLAAYPRDFGRDEDLCRQAGVDAVFYPPVAAMYADDHSAYVEETRLSAGLCGASRPGHFRGVMTVVAKLFNIVLPAVAVFGQKDAQQARVIQRMVRDLDFPVRIVVGDIVREADGLAMSSRNQYLSPGEREQASCLRRALDGAEQLVAGGMRDTGLLCEAVRRVIATAPSAVVDYIAIVDDSTLEPLERVRGRTLLALAVRVGKTRLIDNTVLVV